MKTVDCPITSNSSVAYLIEDFYKAPYGKMAADLFRKNPKQFTTKICINDEDKGLVGVLAYKYKSSSLSKDNKLYIQILAGKEDALKHLIEGLKPEYNHDRLLIKVPIQLIEYVETLKKLGFKKDGRVNSFKSCIDTLLVLEARLE